MFQALTRDRDALVRAVDRVSLQDRSARFRFGSPYISEQQAEQIDRFDGELTAGNEAFELAVAQFAVEFMCGRPAAIQMVRERVRNILEEGQRYSRASLSMVETTVRSLAPLPGRKIVVLLSEGFFLGQGTWYDSAYDVRRITDAATRSGAAVYSLDAGGLTLPAPAGDITEREASAIPGPLRASVERFQDEARREGMKAVAEETGGFAVLGNDIGAGLHRILADNEVYYLLAYEPVSPRRAGRFRGVQVRLPGRPDLVARTRKGYFEPPASSPDRKQREPTAKQAAAQAQERLHDAFTSIVPLQGLPIRLLADFVDLPDAGPTVVVNVDADVAAPSPLVDGGPRPRSIVEIVGLVSDKDGASVEQFAARPELKQRPAAAPDGATREGISLSRRLHLKPGLYQVRVAAIGEASDQTGSASRWVEVPDLTARHLTLSGLFLDAARNGATAASAGGSPDGNQAGSTGRVLGSFPTGSEVDLVFFVYNARADGGGATDLAARYQIRADGQLVHEFQPRPLRSDGAGGPDRIAGVVRLSLAGLPPGDYELRAVVEDRRAGATAERGIDFTVE